MATPPPGRVLLRWEVTWRDDKARLYIPLSMLILAVVMTLSDILWIFLVVLDGVFLSLAFAIGLKYTITTKGIQTGSVFRPWNGFDAYTTIGKLINLRKSGRPVFGLPVIDMHKTERIVSRFLKKKYYAIPGR
ncbi:MAG: hypothetical protein V1839_02835 [archaeon]